MILLRSRVTPESHAQIVGVFGLGLIGSAILDRLRQRGSMEIDAVRLSWNAPDFLRQQLHDCGERLVPIFGRGPGTCHFLWRAGFAADAAETRRELVAFETVLEWVRNCAGRFSNVEFGFSLISSAGGIYEGQRRVDASSRCQPCRPYGVLKLDQEHLVCEITLPCTPLSLALKQHLNSVSLRVFPS